MIPRATVRRTAGRLGRSVLDVRPARSERLFSPYQLFPEVRSVVKARDKLMGDHRGVEIVGTLSREDMRQSAIVEVMLDENRLLFAVGENNEVPFGVKHEPISPPKSD